MDNKNSGELSAEELLRQLRENVKENGEAKPGSKKYKFRQSERVVSPVSEDTVEGFMPKDNGGGFVSPVPKSDIEGLDVEELMRIYMPEDYELLASRKAKDKAEEKKDLGGDDRDDRELFRSLSEMEEVFSESDDHKETDFPAIDISEEKSYAAPDSALFDTLSEGGKVCDIPAEPDEQSGYDTLVASRRKIEGLPTPEELLAMQKNGGTAVFIPDLTIKLEEENEPVEVDQSGTLEMEKVKKVSLESTGVVPSVEDAVNTLNDGYTEGDYSEEFSEDAFVSGGLEGVKPSGEYSSEAYDEEYAEDDYLENGYEFSDEDFDAAYEGAFGDEFSSKKDKKSGKSKNKAEQDESQIDVAESAFREQGNIAPESSATEQKSSEATAEQRSGTARTASQIAFNFEAEPKDGTVKFGSFEGGHSAGDSEPRDRQGIAAEPSEEFKPNEELYGDTVLNYSAKTEISFDEEQDGGLNQQTDSELNTASEQSMALEKAEQNANSEQTVAVSQGDSLNKPTASEQTNMAEENDLPVTLTEEDVASSEVSFGGDAGEIERNISRAFGMDDGTDGDTPIMDEDAEESKKLRFKDNESFEKEFISPTEIKEIQENYKLEYGKASLSFIGTVVIAILLFFYENIGIFGGSLSDIFNVQYYPVVHVMVGLQLLLVGFALSYKRLVAGAVGIMSKKPIPDSLLPLMLAASVIFAVVACFFEAGSLFRTMYFPIALSLCLSAYCRRLDLRREVMTFNIVASKRTKFAIEKLSLDEADLETKAFDEYLPSKADIFKINKTNFVDGYFRRTRAYPSGKLLIGAVIPISVLLSLAAFLVCIFTRRGAQTGAEVAYLMFSFTLPVTLFFTYCLPAFRASKVAFADKSAIVGEVAPDEYTSAASISFDDKEVFPTGGVKLRTVKTFGSGRLDVIIYNMASIYSVLGGPLSGVLNIATADIGHSDDCEILSVENDGVEALVDGHHLYAGKADYLRRHGYVPVSGADDEDIENGGEISIMFLVSDNEVIAKLYVCYRIDPEFEIMLKTLYKSGICVGIKTVDPNINDAMLGTRIKLDKYPVRVLKYADVADATRGQERTDSGIVSRKSTKALLRAFTMCDKIKHLTRTNLALGIIAMVIGIFITVGVVALSTVSAVSSVYVALYQIFWLIPMYLMAKFMIM